jgi:hypothetical protein
MNLRRLTGVGIAKFGEYLDALKQEPGRLKPTDLLADDVSSEEVVPVRSINGEIPTTRLEAAQLLDQLLLSAPPYDTAADIGLWSWLALFYFDALCPSDGSGDRSPRERAAYIPEPGNFRRYYRHLLLGPYLIYQAHRDDPTRAQGLLCKPPHIIDDVVAQIASRYDYVTNPGIVGLTTELYYDVTKSTTKRGAGGKGAGSPRRLADVLKQLDLTWDLYGMPVAELRQLLPREFNRFLPA